MVGQVGYSGECRRKGSFRATQSYCPSPTGRCTDVLGIGQGEPAGASKANTMASRSARHGLLLVGAGTRVAMARGGKFGKEGLPHGGRGTEGIGG